LPKLPCSNFLAQITHGNPEGCDPDYRIGTPENSRDENEESLAAESLLPWSTNAKPVMNNMTAATNATTAYSQLDIEDRRAFWLTAE
jgi:hypothetical protein